LTKEKNGIKQREIDGREDEAMGELINLIG
jgi:hypothetical protein